MSVALCGRDLRVTDELAHDLKGRSFGHKMARESVAEIVNPHERFVLRHFVAALSFLRDRLSESRRFQDLYPRLPQAHAGGFFIFPGE